MEWHPPQHGGVHRAPERNAATWGPERPVPSSVFVELDNQSDPAVGAPRAWPMNGSAPARRLPSPQEHRHLSSLLLVHDVLCRQGVAMASQLLSHDEIADGVDACIFFDLMDLAAAVSEIPFAAMSARSAGVFDDEYQRRYARTDVIVEAILRHMATRTYESPHRPAA